MKDGNPERGLVLRRRHYAAPDDLYRVQAALMDWVRVNGYYNLWHKGDIGHRLFNGCYGYDPAGMFHYWLNKQDEIGAFALFYPRGESFDLQVAPPLLHSDLHVALFEHCESEMLRLAQRFDLRMKEIVVEAFDCDSARRTFVEARGYRYDKHSLTMTRHGLTDLPTAELPAGFRFHRARSSDADRLADVHNHTFTNKWNAESYGAVFRAPHLEYEFVVVAPDGRFAAFTNVWIDEVNRSLLFEPVGTHSDFRRRGIGKALMLHVLRRMQQERGIECAFVCHEPPAKNPASCALYASVGFRKLHDIREYKKPVS